MVNFLEFGDVLPGKHPLSRLTTYFIEIYILVIFYFTQLYHGTRIMETLLGFYIGFALLLSFSYFELGNELIHADTRVSAIILIRLSITVNTLPAFITVFERARKEEIGGFGKNGLSFSAASVYFAKFITLSIPRILFFIPFTAIVYPLIGLASGFQRILVFFFVLTLQQAASIALGLFLSAVFVDRNVGATITSMVTLSVFFFSGSIITRSETPPSVRWLEYLSYSFYAHQALVHNEFLGRDYGKAYLESRDLDLIPLWLSISFLLVYTVICSILGAAALYMTSFRYRC